MKKNFDTFFKETCEELNQLGWKVLIEPVIDDIGESNGFVDYAEKLLAVKKVGKWQPYYVHEYCHYLQLKAGLFVDIKPYLPFYDTVIYGDTHYSKEEVLESCKAVQVMEADCERRAVEIIKNNNFGFDIEDYIQKANAYVSIYEGIRLNNRWFKLHPDKSDGLKKLMPNDRILKDEEFYNPSEEIVKAYEEFF